MTRQHVPLGAAVALFTVVAIAALLINRSAGAPQSASTDPAGHQERPHGPVATRPESANAGSPVESHSVYVMYEETRRGKVPAVETLELFYADPDRLRVNRYSSGKSKEEASYSLSILLPESRMHVDFSGGGSRAFDVTIIDGKPSQQSLRPSETEPEIPRWVSYFASSAPFGRAETARTMVEQGLAVQMNPDTACGRPTVVFDLAATGGQGPHRRRVVELDADTYLLLESREYGPDDDVPSRSLVCLKVEYAPHFDADTFSIEPPPGSKVTRTTIFDIDGDTNSRLSFVPLVADAGEEMDPILRQAVIRDSVEGRSEFVKHAFASPDGGKQILIEQQPHGSIWPRGSLGAQLSWALTRRSPRAATLEIGGETAVLYEVASGLDAKTSGHRRQFLLDVGEVHVAFVSIGVGDEEAMRVLQSLRPMAPSALESSSADTD